MSDSEFFLFALESATVAQLEELNFQTLPKSERVAGELVPLSPTDQLIVWQETEKASKGKAPTADKIDFFAR
jgi:hypothetical protein